MPTTITTRATTPTNTKATTGAVELFLLVAEEGVAPEEGALDLGEAITQTRRQVILITTLLRHTTTMVGTIRGAVFQTIEDVTEAVILRTINIIVIALPTMMINLVAE